MKTLSILLHFVMILFLAHTDAVACSLSPTAKILTDPEGTVFYHGNAVVLDGSTSTANCGSIDQYRWQIDDVTVSWSSVYSHTFNLVSGESERVFKVQLRVRNTAGKYGYKTIYVTVTRNNKSLYYLTDHLGSVRVTVNEQGDPVGWDDYYPFGLQMPGRTQNASNPNDDQKFTGYLLEQEGDLGIYHAEARLYDPVVGRFMQRDPLADEFPGWSSYTYTFNNPLRYIDPDGRAPGDFFDQNGRFLGTDGIDDGKVFVVTNNKEAKSIKNTNKKGGTTQVSEVNSAVLLPNRTALNESLNVLDRTLANGGLREESSIVMRDGTVVKGETGPEVKAGDATATASLPGLPAGRSDQDVAAMIHSHPTGAIVDGNTIHSSSALAPGPADPGTFSRFGNNVIVGRLGLSTAQRTSSGRINVSQPGLGVVFFNRSAQLQVALSRKAVERIIKK